MELPNLNISLVNYEKSVDQQIDQLIKKSKKEIRKARNTSNTPFLDHDTTFHLVYLLEQKIRELKENMCEPLETNRTLEGDGTTLSPLGVAISGAAENHINVLQDGLSVTTIKGDAGLSAFEIAVEYQGFTGTEVEWLQSLQGATGISGINPRGIWNEFTSNYVQGDVVTWLNPEGYIHSYWASGNVPVGVSPADSTYWNILVMQGQTGRPGPPGERGPQGPPGIGNGTGSGFHVGENLSTKFQDEITEMFGGDPWPWVQDRIQSGNYSGINVGDFIPFHIGNVLVEAVVGDINLYTGSGDEPIPNHIDFISRDLFTQTIQWNAAAFSNGTVAHPAPWLNSLTYAYLNGLQMEVVRARTQEDPPTIPPNPPTMLVDYSENGLYPRLPQSLKDVIIQKRVFLPNRYNANAIALNDTGATWQDIGFLWLPAETEITSAPHYGGSMAPSNHSHSVRGFLQYEIFRRSIGHRIKRNPTTGSPAAWFTLTNQGNNASTIVSLTIQGLTNNTQPTSALRTPVCFRIG